MNKETLSPAELEQLLAQLAPPQDSRPVRMQRARERACRAARAEINRRFLYRYSLRAACCAALLALLGAVGSLLLPQRGENSGAPAALAAPEPAARQFQLRDLPGELPAELGQDAHLSYDRQSRFGASSRGGYELKALPVMY